MIRITRDEFYRAGGLSNRNLTRRQTRRGSWRYYAL